MNGVSSLYLNHCQITLDKKQLIVQDHIRTFDLISSYAQS